MLTSSTSRTSRGEHASKCWCRRPKHPVAFFVEETSTKTTGVTTGAGEAQKGLPARGLRNDGNDCYLNALMQAISHISSPLAPDPTCTWARDIQGSCERRQRREASANTLRTSAAGANGPRTTTTGRVQGDYASRSSALCGPRRSVG